MKCQHACGRASVWFLAVLHLGISRPVEADDRPEVVPLWEQSAPLAKGAEPQDKPRLIVYRARKSATVDRGKAVVICPGGGYGHLAMDHEGHDIARWLNSQGITGLVLDYRHKGKGYQHPAPLLDAQRAVRLARHRAKAWGVDPQRVGIMGFSAGGHLAASAATHFDRGNAQADDPVDRASCRPDFVVLCYPVIAFDQPFTHRGSQHNLLGKDAPAERVREMSAERAVTQETPPTFLWHTSEDQAVPPENSMAFYAALRRVGVPGELHIFETGGHGLGLAPKLPAVNAWAAACERWLAAR